GLSGRARPDSRGLSLRVLPLLEPFHQIKISQHAMVAEDAGFGVGRHENGTNVFYAGGIGGHELLKQGALPGFQIDAIDSRRQLAGLVNIEEVAVATEGDGLFSLLESSDDMRIAAGNGIQVSFLVRTDNGHRLGIRRNRKELAVDPLRSKRLALAGSHIVN